MDDIIVAQDLYKTYYRDGQAIPVLKGINLKVKKEEIISIVGPSGVGKSTLLHLLGALDRPTKGKVFLGEEGVYSLNDKGLATLRNRRIGFLFQFHHLLSEFTALENVMMPGLIKVNSPPPFCPLEIDYSISGTKVLEIPWISQGKTKRRNGDRQKLIVKSHREMEEKAREILGVN